eukprot:TRINITY_DN3204_c0_g1_i1.p1 TRINITY_DN3204_c0_g1~~TRINITY_DN3204_c0_g1_i1.p1  ORF type:complete len:100 (-),score=14.13 TRINITY_DN3204_c0_g1_i1:141-440(-)
MDIFGKVKNINGQNLLGRFPETEGSITTIWDYDKQPGYTMTDVHSKNGLMQALYWGGPTRVGTTRPSRHLAPHVTFADIPNSLPAGVQNGNYVSFFLYT